MSGSKHKLARTLALVCALSAAVPGCGGPLLRLAKDGDWAELDRQARAAKRPPRGKAARAWAEALVELGQVEEARAVLLRDFRQGGEEPSLLALAELERELGLRGIAAAHHTRLLTLDLDSVQGSDAATEVCELLRARARAEAAIGEPQAADTDMRRVALVCPASITDADRGFLASLHEQVRAQAVGQRSLPDGLAPTPAAIAELDGRLAEQLELARKRSPAAMIGLAEAERIQLEPDDVAMLLAAELAGALGPGLVSSQRLSAWIGDLELDAVLAAVDTLPEGARAYALLRLAKVRAVPQAASERQTWIVAAMGSLTGQGPQEAAKSWRVAAITGDLGGAEFALNTNLRDMIPVAEPGPDGQVGKSSLHWSRRVPVDRRSFDLLLTLARLLELRDQQVLALELRRAVIVAGHELGLAQVGPAAAEEVLRLLALGRPWQALAVAEVVPGPLVDELLPAVGSALALAEAAGLGEVLEGDRNIVWRALGDAWFADWQPRLDAARAGLDLQADPGHAGCPALGDWLQADRSEVLARVGLDAEASRAALTAALTSLAAPETGAALLRAVEADLALACSAPAIELLHAGSHRLALVALAERLTQAPELAGAAQLQLAAEVALAIGDGDRAQLATLSAAAQSGDPRAIWARAASAGARFGVREYTLEALRQVLLHTDGLDDPAARRALLLVRLRDVDTDASLRGGDEPAATAIRAAIQDYLDEVPAARRWGRLDDLLWTLAAEPRADAAAWALLRDLLGPALDPAQHPHAVAALDRASAATDAAPVSALELAELDTLGDAEAICERARLGIDGLDRPGLLGAALACSAQTRADALAALLARAESPVRVRERVLAGPVAVEIDPRQPGVLRSVPALAREGLALRVAFELDVGPIWVSGASTPG